jgi:aerobic-type carbon monoxide dehydrogenase small subunit (CoxS/CutS family)
MEQTFHLTVNGQSRTVTTDSERPLLEVLREELHLTGPKFGCGEGQCGACTVLTGSKSIHSCVTTISEVEGQNIRTIEGLAEGDKLHPVQEAFLAEAASQCGYCTPGMIMALVGLLEFKPTASKAEIQSHMEGNLCRCCNYQRLLNSIDRAATQVRRAAQ